MKREVWAVETGLEELSIEKCHQILFGKKTNPRQCVMTEKKVIRFLGQENEPPQDNAGSAIEFDGITITADLTTYNSTV